MTLTELSRARTVAGTKEVLRAIAAGRAELVLLASDSQERVAGPVIEACEAAGVKLERTYTRVQLGEACQLPVRAAAVAVLAPSR